MLSLSLNLLSLSALYIRADDSDSDDSNDSVLIVKMIAKMMVMNKQVEFYCISFDGRPENIVQVGELIPSGITQQPKQQRKAGFFEMRTQKGPNTTCE